MSTHATTSMRIAVVIDDRGLGVPEVRAGLSTFVEALRGHAEVGVFSAVRPEATVVDFTADTQTLLEGIQQLRADGDGWPRAQHTDPRPGAGVREAGYRASGHGRGDDRPGLQRCDGGFAAGAARSMPRVKHWHRPEIQVAEMTRWADLRGARFPPAQ